MAEEEHEVAGKIHPPEQRRPAVDELVLPHAQPKHVAAQFGRDPDGDRAAIGLAKEGYFFPTHDAP